MIISPLRMLADWFEHEDYGVNALIPELVLDQSSDRPPYVAAIRDTTRDIYAARNNAGFDFPALIVHPDGPFAIGRTTLGTARRDAQAMPVGVEYVMPGDIEPNTAQASAYLTFEAVLASIDILMSNEMADKRTRNGIQLIARGDALAGPLAELVTFGERKGLVVAGLVFDLTVRDTRPILSLQLA